MTLLSDLDTAITAAIRATDTPWALNRERVTARMRIAVFHAVEPFLAKAVENAVASHIAAQADANVVQYRIEFDSGYRAGHQAALLEADTMLKRHGHRTAVTRVLELADADVKTPARPQPAQSPADEPGNPPTAPDTQEGATGAPEGPVGPETATPDQPVTRTQVRDITREYLRDVQRQAARRG